MLLAKLCCVSAELAMRWRLVLPILCMSGTAAVLSAALNNSVTPAAELMLSSAAVPSLATLL